MFFKPQVDGSSPEIRREEGGQLVGRGGDHHGGQGRRKVAHHVRRQRPLCHFPGSRLLSFYSRFL